jgi:hypothetical protein
MRSPGDQYQSQPVSFDMQRTTMSAGSDAPYSSRLLLEAAIGLKWRSSFFTMSLMRLNAVDIASGFSCQKQSVRARGMGIISLARGGQNIDSYAKTCWRKSSGCFQRLGRSPVLQRFAAGPPCDHTAKMLTSGYVLSCHNVLSSG